MSFENKIFAVVVIVLLSVYIMNPITLFNIFYYIKNGSTVDLCQKYKINLPFSHWAYYANTKDAHSFIGRVIDEHDSMVTVFTYPNKIDIKSLVKSCDNIVREKQSFNKIKYFTLRCIENNKQKLYLLSYDQKLILHTESFPINNKNIANEYNLLFNNIHYSPFAPKPK